MTCPIQCGVDFALVIPVGRFRKRCPRLPHSRWDGCATIAPEPTRRDELAGSMRFNWVSRISPDNLRPLLSLFSEDLAIDLGTVNTRVYVRDRGIVINEPSAIALDDRTGEVRAVGKEAKEMLGRTPSHLRVVKPLQDGVIADFRVTEAMLNYFIQKAHQRRTLVHPRIVISVPSEITQVEKRAVTDAAYRAKAAEVHLVEQAMMAAIGAGMPVTEPRGNMIVDIGGGTTDIAVISFCGIVYSRSLRSAGNHMDEAIINYLKRKHNLLIGERTTEQTKIEIGSAYALDKPLTMEIKGRCLIEGKPKTITAADSEIREALSECVSMIVSAIRMALERTPPELSADISDRGIVLAGGGSLLKNLDKRIREETGTTGVRRGRSLVLRSTRHCEDS
jgi:rod shape-determining protein MreB and related proteins